LGLVHLLQVTLEAIVSVKLPLAGAGNIASAAKEDVEKVLPSSERFGRGKYACDQG
jgi:hypothetical protein